MRGEQGGILPTLRQSPHLQKHRNYVTMLTRIVNLPETLNFFLFGARATGKSTLLNQKFSAFDTFTFDLLKNEDLLPFLDSPNSLSKALDALSSEIKQPISRKTWLLNNLCEI